MYPSVTAVAPREDGRVATVLGRELGTTVLGRELRCALPGRDIGCVGNDLSCLGFETGECSGQIDFQDLYFEWQLPSLSQSSLQHPFRMESAAMEPCHGHCGLFHSLNIFFLTPVCFIV